MFYNYLEYLDSLKEKGTQNRGFDSVNGSALRYTVREPEDGQWGLLADGGNWTGLVGILQYEKADFSLDITLTQERLKVVDFSTLYGEDLVVIVSPKPKPLPEYLSLVRPFEGKYFFLYFRLHISLVLLKIRVRSHFFLE